MAVKRTKKKSTTKKNEDESDEIQNTENIDGENTTLEAKNETTNEKREYKIYDAEGEFKLKEIFSKDNNIIIGPPRLTRFEKARITGARIIAIISRCTYFMQNSS